ncbi:hypothetical protein ZIOFF_015590 [Zingiber officinale]|uniref:Uncharacterized protein n=1 Tax=Zingiber officinale TaxID=94328 RepID=A0A8J5LFF3_ZINOF|nr:hypothetical protein ZIOFF_015590 [Zingiber officinale]
MLPPPPLIPSNCTDFDAGSAAYEQLRPRRSKLLRPSSSPAAAPRLHPSPFHPSSSAIPFSWEHRPGVPKAPSPLAAGSSARPLLPPPLRSAPIGIKGTSLGRRDDDPFAAALAECAKSPLGPVIPDLFGRSGERSRTPTSAAGWSISYRLGLLGIHASCKTASAVADSTVLVRRSGVSYGRMIRRAT